MEKLNDLQKKQIEQFNELKKNVKETNKQKYDEFEKNNIWKDIENEMNKSNPRDVDWEKLNKINDFLVKKREEENRTEVMTFCFAFGGYLICMFIVVGCCVLIKWCSKDKNVGDIPYERQQS